MVHKVRYKRLGRPTLTKPSKFALYRGPDVNGAADGSDAVRREFWRLFDCAEGRS